MKVSKIFAIDEDVYDKLRLEGNMSAIVNKLLVDYYGSNSTVEERQKEVDKIIIKAQTEQEKIDVDFERQQKQIAKSIEANNNEWEERKKLSAAKKAKEKAYEQYLKDNKLDFKIFTYQNWLDDVFEEKNEDVCLECGYPFSGEYHMSDECLYKRKI